MQKTCLSAVIAVSWSDSHTRLTLRLFMQIKQLFMQITYDLNKMFVFDNNLKLYANQLCNVCAKQPHEKLKENKIPFKS